MPASPGFFHFQGDAEGFKPHRSTSKFESMADAAAGAAYLLRYTAGPVLLLLFSTRPLMMKFNRFGNERGVVWQ
ncbi:hypothetical protein [Phyllobacterium myrsinacearum]|uniref:Uncharacterized protein n=1 Tax=Phyllobacterium myrsinacearum TaxID=28101 RepID=A0A2S9JWM4_9HYPH|nr:hypothetical protein [Phyllobacterium myrsinacearum]PRD57757.1 hypothetical protein C5750_00955 [Phyllobacterium myrsinacearum]